jgi:IclR family pca regulon transcriptional regulator
MAHTDVAAPPSGGYPTGTGGLRRAERMDGADIDDRDYVQSLVRGLEVIRAFSRFRPRMTLSEVAQHTDMTRAAARRFLLTLVREDYAETDGKYFTLRPRVLDLGFAYLTSSGIWQPAQPALREVVERTKESCSLAVLDGEEIVYVLRVPAQRVLTIGLSVGTRLPAHCTALGRVLVAGLPDEDRARFVETCRLDPLTSHTTTDRARFAALVAEAGRRGWTAVDEELEFGLRALAVPVLDGRGRTVAAMCVSAHVERTTMQQLEAVALPALREASARITAALG